MEFILFMLFSTLETAAMYYLMFRIYKFDIYALSIFFTSLIASYISYTLRVHYQLPGVDMLVQILLMTAFVWLLFRVPLFYAALMTGTAYISYILIQLAYYLALNTSGLIATVPQLDAAGTYLMQSLSLLTAWWIGWIVHRRGKGFSFVPHNPNEKVVLDRRSMILLYLYVPALLCAGLLYYLISTSRYSLFFLIPAVLGLVLAAMVFWSYRRDRIDD
jgi:hypothetical protein